MRASITLVAFSFAVACGGNVDLGGTNTIDASILDATQIDSMQDASILECDGLASPNTDSTCRACEHDAGDCQANGCFSGYYCRISARDCEAPPTSCEAGTH
jgi:hypothetical protein